MKTIHLMATVSALLASTVMMPAYANEQECQKLQDQKALIHAAQGYCFKDKAIQKQYSDEECHTKKPKFSEAENKRLAQIESKQKELNCPKKDL